MVARANAVLLYHCSYLVVSVQHANEKYEVSISGASGRYQCPPAESGATGVASFNQGNQRNQHNQSNLPPGHSKHPSWKEVLYWSCTECEAKQIQIYPDRLQD